MNKILILCVIITVSFINSGCAVYMATQQPNKKDVSLFRTGTPRGLILAEFGLPQYEEKKDGKRMEIYKFNKGYGKGAKVGRAFAHGVADVFTFGLWEVVGTPTEVVFDGKEMAYQIHYNEDDKIETVVLLKEK